MAFVARQSVTIQYILQVAKQVNADPRACVHSFFERLKEAENEVSVAFDKELEAFKGRVRDRARVKLEQFVRQIEKDEERKARLGPKPLDSKKGFQSMSECMQKWVKRKYSKTRVLAPKKRHVSYREMSSEPKLILCDIQFKNRHKSMPKICKTSNFFLNCEICGYRHEFWLNH